MRVLRLLAVVLLLASIAAAAAEPAPHAALEAEMVRLLNTDRATHKLPPLTFHPGLARVARGHSQDMHDHKFFAHESKRTGKVGDRVDRAGIAYRACAENIAMEFTVAQAQANLMASPGHRKNILNADHTHIGVGIVGRQGAMLHFTQVFIKAVVVVDAAALPAQLVERINAARAKKGLRRLVVHKVLMRLALEHSQHAEKVGKPEPLWLEDRIARSGRKWKMRDGAYFLTDNLDEVVACPTAMSRRYEEIGIGIVQASFHGKFRGALWVTLLCAQR